MSDAHRRDEMKAILADLRAQSARLVDVMTMAKVKLGQVTLCGGSSIEDFRPDGYELLDTVEQAAADAVAQAKLDDMTAAVAAGNAMLGFVATTIPETSPLTIEQAILRILEK